MDSAEIASIVTIAMLALNYFGITGIDSGMITGAINGILALAAFCAAIWSWYGHRQVNAAS